MPRLLITNCTLDPAAGGVYLLDTASGDLKRIHDQPTRGITRGHDGYYAVGNGGAIYHLDPATWKAAHRAETGLNGAHDLRWFGGNEYYLVASRGNVVARLDREFNLLETLRIVDSDEDVCHANCLIQVDGKQWLSIFTLSPGKREDKRHGNSWRTEGKVLELDWDTRSFRILYEPLCQPHSLIWRDGRLYCCESFTSAVSVVDLASGSRRTLRRLHGFVRGLDFAGGSAYVGISRTRKKMPWWQRMLEKLRHWCGVLEMDPDTWRVKRRFQVPGAEVYEILALD